MGSRGTRIGIALGWVFVAGLATFGTLAILSIGLLLFVPAAALLTWLVLKEVPPPMQLVALLAFGSACAFAAVGVINLPSAPPCTGQPLIASPQNQVAGGERG